MLAGAVSTYVGAVDARGISQGKVVISLLFPGWNGRPPHLTTALAGRFHFITCMIMKPPDRSESVQRQSIDLGRHHLPSKVKPLSSLLCHIDRLSQ